MFLLGIYPVKTALRLPLAAVAVAASLVVSPAVLADAVTEWSVFADSLPLGAPPIRARASAIMHVAMHDAVNSIHSKYESYTDLPRARWGASADAAARQAAASALKGAVVGVPLPPPNTPATIAAAVDAFHAGYLTSCTSASCLDGLAAGEAAANAILALRIGDGSATPHVPYDRPVSPGVYQPTPITSTADPPPSPAAPQFEGWADVLPFVLKRGSQFRAEPSLLFNLKSWAYTRDYNEVKRVGEVTSEADGYRTEDQSQIAQFWPGGGANINAVARVIIADRNLDLWQHARLFALINMAISDSAVAVYDTKYTYNFWRPVTAIRAGDTDGNLLTLKDPDWLSYQNTPPYPDYTCGLTNNVGAGLAVLRSYFGTDRIPYELTIASGLKRSYKSLSQAGFEAVDARVFGGMHFRTGCVRGLMQGGDVGRYVFKHSLQPRGKHGHHKW
jgi:hypothetical protein